MLILSLCSVILHLISLYSISGPENCEFYFAKTVSWPVHFFFQTPAIDRCGKNVVLGPVYSSK